MSSVMVASTLVSLVVPVDVIFNFDVDAGSVEPEIAALLVVSACVVVSVVMVELVAS